MNFQAIKVIYKFEMLRTWRTMLQSIASPVLSTSLYFIVFGSAIGSRIQEVDGVSYGAFIVPGLIMFTLLTQSISNASFGIFFPKFTGTIYEYLSAPISSLEILLGFVGAAATKSFLIGLIILATASLFVDIRIAHPVWMMSFLILTCISFSLLGFIIGLWANDFEKLQIVPLLIITPLVFLGGTFYSISMLPETWQMLTLLNPVVYLVSGFRWSFFEIADVNVYLSLFIILSFLAGCSAVVWWMFKTGYRLKSEFMLMKTKRQTVELGLKMLIQLKKQECIKDAKPHLNLMERQRTKVWLKKAYALFDDTLAGIIPNRL
ncbi:MAG: ABC transporter permease [Thiolinea sp.]